MPLNVKGRPWNAYFSITSVLLLALSVAAFSDNLFTDVSQPSNSDPKFVIHGLFGLAWYVLLVIQANLVRGQGLRLHRKLGVAAFVVAIGVTFSTLYVFIAVWTGWDSMSIGVRANRAFLPAYAFCLLLAWRLRGRPDLHKRLIFVGTFFMQQPVLDRVYDPLVMSWLKPLLSSGYSDPVDEIAFQTFRWIAWIGLFLSLAAYDLGTRGRVHFVTVAGLAWFAFTWLICAFS